MFYDSSILKQMALLSTMLILSFSIAARDQQKGQRDADLRGDRMNKEQLAATCLKDRLNASDFNPNKEGMKRYVEFCKEIISNQKQKEAEEATKKNEQKNKTEVIPQDNKRTAKRTNGTNPNSRKGLIQTRQNNERENIPDTKPKKNENRNSNNNRNSSASSGNSQTTSNSNVTEASFKQLCLSLDTSEQINVTNKNKCCRLLVEFEEVYVNKINRLPKLKKIIQLLNNQGSSEVESRINSKKFNFSGRDEDIGDDFILLDQFFSFISYFYEDTTFNNAKRDIMYKALSEGNAVEANSLMQNAKASILQDFKSATLFIENFDNDMPGNLKANQLKERKQALGCN
jgi:hypothetical protein